MESKPDYLDFTDLDELPGEEHIKGYVAPAANGYLEDQAELAERTLKATNKQRVKVPCGKCGGSGCYMHYGTCFQCHGRGHFLRAANYLKNQAARAERNAKKRAAEQAELEADCQRRIDAFKVARPDLAGWLAANREHSDFARSLCDTVAQYGNLSVGQEAAVLKALGRDQLAEAGAHRAETDIDVSSLKGYYAVPDGETRLKIRVNHPGKDSKYHGWTFVTDGAAYGQQQKYGSQRPGGKYTGRVQEQLRAILADPRAAQIAYGHLTGSCGVCGRILEDAESIAAGIGPICAAKGA